MLRVKGTCLFTFLPFGAPASAQREDEKDSVEPLVFILSLSSLYRQIFSINHNVLDHQRYILFIPNVTEFHSHKNNYKKTNLASSPDEHSWPELQAFFPILCPFFTCEFETVSKTFNLKKPSFIV